ncbi:MAG: pyridoxine 5'-phosphate synthase [Bacteroidales bacterium]|uniref:pyridoxine 5'-phosphate synthase n=1 Tax=Porphyromonas sp. TaxID=1924944 RepID=UPI00297B0364|nr:pyridoxine 5'-phosphate synthase [Porphyromonas sp.]MDD7438117.1 pyridoxine 5'-phosphate synthase [Bacteroidales bacterium]MDY3066415.1 pyridoxine 5'-phosphate synthase [Porphyromonas sp.]
MKTRLSVNVNKIATIRNARGGNNPDLIQMSRDIERFGAEGITVHPRPDERHIRYADVYALKKIVSTEFNIEGYPSPDFMKLVLDVKPTQVTLVPDPPGVLTSNAGWEVGKHFDFLKDIIQQLKECGIRTSIFVDTDLGNIQTAREVGTDRIELYTEPYAANYHKDREAAVRPFVEAAKVAGEVGLEVNAGHDLDLHNLRYLAQQLPNLAEVSIGHALICDALYLGIEETVKRYLECLR